MYKIPWARHLAKYRRERIPYGKSVYSFYLYGATPRWPLRRRASLPPRRSCSKVPARTSCSIGRWADHALLDADKAPVSARLAAYRVQIQCQLNLDPVGLLDRYSQTALAPEDGYNLAVVRQNPGDLRPIRCLEALLLEAQVTLNPKMLSEPTEFFRALSYGAGRAIAGVFSV